MFANRFRAADLRRLAPRPRRPRLGSRPRHHGWSLRHAALGVELRGTALYLACLLPGWNRRWLAATGTIHDFAQLSAEQLRERIREVVAAAGAEDPVVVLGLPRRDTVVRHLQLPAAAENSLDSVLNLQLDLYKPSDDEEFCWDAAVARDEQQLAVSLAFAPRARVQEATSRLADAGYPASRVTTAQFATLDWMLRGREDGGAAARLLTVQSCGAEVEFAVAENGACIYSRSFLLESASETAAAGHVAAQIRQSLATLRSGRNGPFTVVTAGAQSESWHGALAEFGAVEHIGRYCEAEELMSAAGVHPAELEPFWGAIALGLNGLSWTGDYRLNLLPKELRATRRRWQNAPTYALLALNLLLVAALAGRSPLQRHLMLKRYQRESERIEKPAAVVERQMRKQRQIEERLDALRQFQEQGRKPLDALSEIAQKLPPEAWVNSYSYRQGEVALTGTAKSAAALLPALKSSSEMEDVQFRGALTRESGGVERFQMQIKLRASR